MNTRSELSKALDEAFRAAFLLTGTTECAENAVLDGIAASEVDRIVDEGLLVESVKSAIQRRADDPAQPEQAGLYLPLELRRLFLLAPISHDCFMLRVLLGINVGTCSRIMRLGIDEFGEVLCAALQELPRLEAHSATRCEITQM